MKFFYLALALLLTACATPAKNVASPAFGNTASQKPKKVLLLPPNVEVMEISAGGVPEKVETWSQQARHNIEQSLHQVVGGTHHFELTEITAVSASEKAQVEQYLALYEVVGRDAFVFSHSTDAAWQQKRSNFDYSLGNGLRFLKQKTGADAALFVIGADQISTGGRKAAMFLGAMIGVVIPAGMSFVSTGLVDLETGNILWLNYDWGGGEWDIRERADTDKLIANIFKDYPVSQ